MNMYNFIDEIESRFKQLESRIERTERELFEHRSKNGEFDPPPAPKAEESELLKLLMPIPYAPIEKLAQQIRELVKKKIKENPHRDWDIIDEL